MWLSASWGKSAVFYLMNLLKPPLVSPLTPGESGIIRDMNRSAFLSRRKKGKTDFLHAGTRANVRVFNINSLSSRTQLGHLYLTHSIGSEWIWIYGPKEGATGWITKWNLRQTLRNGGQARHDNRGGGAGVFWSGVNLKEGRDSNCVVISSIYNSLPRACCIFI